MKYVFSSSYNQDQKVCNSKEDIQQQKNKKNVMLITKSYIVWVKINGSL